MTSGIISLQFILLKGDRLKYIKKNTNRSVFLPLNHKPSNYEIIDPLFCIIFIRPLPDFL